MKIGDLVRHKKKGWVGIVADFMNRNSGVLVDLSDEEGVMFRWISIYNLEVIDEDRGLS